MRPDRSYLLISVPCAAAGAVLSARYGAGYFLLFTYILLPVFLVILRRLLPFYAHLPQADVPGLLKWWRHAGILIAASLISALLTFWVHDFGWLDLGRFPEPLVSGQSVVNGLVFRPVADAQHFVGRYTLALYYFWAAWTSIHLCLAWRVDWGATRGLALTRLLLLFACWAYVVGGMIFLMIFANTTNEYHDAMPQQIIGWGVATFVFSAAPFVGKSMNYIFATLLARVR